MELRTLWRDDGKKQWALFLFMFLFYGFLLSDLGLAPRDMPLDLTFDSMLDHMLHGRFDVDPSVIGDEGFLRNGLVISYWGIWCALLRLPLWALHRLDVDVTTASCLLAACVAGFARVRTVFFLRAHAVRTGGARDEIADRAFAMMTVYSVFGGSGLGFLKSSIFQEIVLWAAAFGAIFVYFTVKGVVLKRFDGGTLCGMAAAAGLALLTRVSTGLGLCIACGIVFAMLPLLRMFGENRPARRWSIFTQRGLVLATAVLAALMFCAGTVNYYRWGNPTTFADHTRYLMNRHYPDRMPRTRLYGYFNLQRVPFGMGYYFLPVWALRDSHGGLLFQATQTRLIDAVELPPSSLLLTDLLPFCFIGWLALALAKRRANELRPMAIWTGAAVALLVPCGLMLTAISMNYRYRMEFYPELQLLGFLGVYAVASDAAILDHFGRYQGWMRSALWVTVISAFASMVLYKMSPFGPAEDFLHQGLVHFYRYDALN